MMFIVVVIITFVYTLFILNAIVMTVLLDQYYVAS